MESGNKKLYETLRGFYGRDVSSAYYYTGPTAGHLDLSTEVVSERFIEEYDDMNESEDSSI